LDSACNLAAEGKDGQLSHQPFFTCDDCFLTYDLSGEHIWLTAPSARLPAYIRYYQEWKAKFPQTTSACIAVLAEDLDSLHLLKGMQLLKQFNKGEHVFATGSREPSKASAAPWSFLVYYDPPAATLAPSRVPGFSKSLLVLAGSVSGYPARAALDTQASCCFISSQFVRRASLVVSKPHDARSIVLADGSQAMSHGLCRVPLRMDAYSGKITCHVLDNLVVGMDVVLGGDWLIQQRAVLDCERQTCVVRKGRRKITLKAPSVRDPAAEADAPVRCSLIQARQLPSALKNAAAVHLLAVSAADSAPAKVVSTQPDTLLQPHVLENLLAEYEDLFAAPPPELPPIRHPAGHVIPTEPGALSSRLIFSDRPVTMVSWVRPRTP
jgi:hypothetical protein